MLILLLNLIKSPKNFFIPRSTHSKFYHKNLVMASENIKTKTDLNFEHSPVKKIKISDEVKMNTRTVATMCGAWRPEEEDGGLILVFKMRKECLSPDPTKESDYPENIEDFWEGSFITNDDIQARKDNFGSRKLPAPVWFAEFVNHSFKEMAAVVSKLANFESLRKMF